jgi:dihydrofolate reductase
MSNLIWHVTMSLDGFIAGPDDSMDWVVAQWSDRGRRTREIEVQRSRTADDVLQNAGAILGGRRWYDVAVRKFDGYDGIYGGQWHGPVFVLTHRPPDESHPAVTFLSGDLGEAVQTAAKAAAGKAVIVFGANIALQCLRAGLLDEMVVHLVPVLLGDGVRLIGDAASLGPIPLERTLTATAGQITDLRFAVRGRN